MTHLTRRSVLTGAATTLLARPIAARPDQPIRLLANENPYGPSPIAAAAAEAALPRAWQYAFKEENALRDLIAKRERLDPENVLMTAGSTEALRLAALLYFQKAGELVSALPTFPFLPSYAKTLGARVREVPLNSDFWLDFDAMVSAVSKETNLVYVCNPNNPTGAAIPGVGVRRFLDRLPEGLPTVVDEAYVELTQYPEKMTVVDRVRAGDPVIITRTFSKLHGLAGLRVGYVLAPPAIIDSLKKLRMTMSNVLSASCALASYQDQEFQIFSRDKIKEGREVVYEVCDSADLRYVRSQANFVLVELGQRLDDFRQVMRQRNILVGREYPPLMGWCRISVGTLEQMEYFASEFRRYLGIA